MNDTTPTSIREAARRFNGRNETDLDRHLLLTIIRTADYLIDAHEHDKSRCISDFDQECPFCEFRAAYSRLCKGK